MDIKPTQFSIIVPIYRVEAYLPQAIESVLAQSVSDWELILVDDGSPDGCGEICDRYAKIDARIRVIHKENGGLVSARQAGIAECRGNYVLNLDADDYWDDTLLSELEAVICRHHPDCISFGYRSVTEDGNTIAEVYSKTSAGLYLGETLEQLRNRILYNPQKPEINTGDVIYSLCVSAFRRELVAPIQRMVPQQIKMGEDAAVAIPAFFQCESIYFLKKAEYNYRIRGSSISRTFSYSEIKETIQLITYLKTHAEQLPAENLDGYLYRMAENYWIKAARNLPNYREFRECVGQSLQMMPEGFMQCVSTFHLCLKNKLRFLVVKNNLWFLLWLFYHRN